MNVNHINQIKDLIHFAKETTGKSAHFEISMWSHSFKDEQTAEYRVWIEDLFNQSSKETDMLIALIPYIKNLCVKNAIKANNSKLKELAA